MTIAAIAAIARNAACVGTGRASLRWAPPGEDDPMNVESPRSASSSSACCCTAAGIVTLPVGSVVVTALVPLLAAMACAIAATATLRRMQPTEVLRDSW